MAVAAFKVKIFSDPQALQAYVVSAGGGVTTVVAIVTDNSGKFILFYT